MGLLSGLISAATNAVGANENAQANAAKSNMAATLQRAQLQRQDQQDQIAQALQAREAQSQALKDQLTGAQIKDTNSQAEQRAYALAHPKPNYSSPITSPNGQVSLIDLNDPMHPVKVPGIQGKVEHEPQGPRDQLQLVQTPGPDGKPVYYRVNLTTGEKTPLDLSAVQRGGGGGGASGAQVPVADMEQRYQEIAQHAKDLADGKWKISSSMQTREGLNYANAVDNAAGHPSITHQFLSGTLNSVGAGGDDYDRYQALLNSTRALGDDVAKVFKGRQNEQAVMREVALSELTPDDYGNPKVVEQKLSRLQHIINLAKLNNPSQESIGEPSGNINLGKPAGTASQAQQLWDKSVAKYGKAKVIQEYGERPSQ